MKLDPIDDTILFPGSPWPAGHAIESFLWYLQLESPGQIRCHFDLESAAYNANDESEDDDETDGTPNWRSKIVWNNYGSCTLSSLAWDHSGFVIATSMQPLDITTLSGRTFDIDPLPFDFAAEPSFGIYCQGHDNVAGHKISLTNGSNGWTVDWRAKIALTYLGATEFENDLVARKTAVKFPNVTVPNGVAAADAEKMLRKCIGRSTKIELVDGEDGDEFRIFSG